MAKATITTSLAKKPPLPTGTQRKTRIFDDKLTGFFIEAWPSGTVVFWVRYTDDRHRVREVRLGKFGDITVDQARKRAQEMRAQITLGADPGGERDKRKAVPTFGDFVTNQYLPYIKERLRSFGTVEGHLRLRIMPRWEKRCLDEIKAQDLIKLQSELRKEGLANGTINRHTAVIRRVFNLAIRWEVVEMKNPAQYAEMLREQHREVFLSGPEMRRLFQALDEEPSKSAAACIALLALTGARRGEALAMRWEDVDIDNRTWKIPISKSGRTRHIPLSDAAVAVLARQREMPGVSPYVFHGPKPTSHLAGIRKCWERVVAKAGLAPTTRIHDLRHSFASFLVNNGRPIYEVAQILGHTQLSTTQRYSHFENTRLVESANIAGRIAGKI